MNADAPSCATVSFPRKREPIFQRPRDGARWVPAFAGTTAEDVARVRRGAARKAPQALRSIVTSARRGKVRRRHDDVPRKACPFEQADQQPGDVELPPAQAMAGGTGIGVVIVVPALACGEEPDEHVVLAVVVGSIAAVAPQMGE